MGCGVSKPAKSQAKVVNTDNFVSTKESVRPTIQIHATESLTTEPRPNELKIMMETSSVLTSESLNSQIKQPVKQFDPNTNPSTSTNLNDYEPLIIPVKAKPPELAPPLEESKESDSKQAPDGSPTNHEPYYPPNFSAASNNTTKKPQPPPSAHIEPLIETQPKESNPITYTNSDLKIHISLNATEHDLNLLSQAYHSPNEPRFLTQHQSYCA